MIVQKSTSKNVKVMKDKKRLRNSHRIEEIRGMMAKCNWDPALNPGAEEKH